MTGLFEHFMKKKKKDIHLPATTEKGKRKEEELGIRPPKGLFGRMMEGKKTIDEMAGKSKGLPPEQKEEARKRSRQFFMNIGMRNKTP